MKSCSICGKKFVSYNNIGTVCSISCRKEKTKINLRKLREDPIYRSKQIEWNNKWNVANREKRLFIKLKSQNKRRKRIICGDFSYCEWQEIKKQFDFSCVICGRKEPDIKLTQDHIIPLSKGGEHTKSNIQPLCRNCNSQKSNKLNFQTCYRMLK